MNYITTLNLVQCATMLEEWVREEQGAGRWCICTSEWPDTDTEEVDKHRNGCPVPYALAALKELDEV
jgi:hypothetical protein